MIAESFQVSGAARVGLLIVVPRAKGSAEVTQMVDYVRRNVGQRSKVLTDVTCSFILSVKYRES